MFYDEFVALCDSKGVSRTKACMDCGVSRTAWHKWEDGATPNGATLSKFAEYFGVSVSFLLGEEKAPTAGGEREDIAMDDFTYAMYNEAKDLPAEKKRMLLEMVRFMKADMQKDGKNG